MSILAQTNKTLEKLFNNSENCLFIIKKLSTQINCSNEKIAETLQIKEARNRLYLQKTFLSYCKRFAHPYDDENRTLKRRFAQLKRDNIDFNFTYGNEHHTGLMAALCPVNPEPATAQYLILNGADLYLEDKNGFSAHSRIFSHHPYIIPFLVEHKKLEPNKKNGPRAQTPLINLMLYLISYNHSQYDIQSIENGMKILFEAEADPKLEDKNNRSPLYLACLKQNQYPQFVTLLEDAIKKKHAVK
jgi:hypothetical protein